MMIAAATKTSFSKYDLTEVSGTLRSCGCDIGGGVRNTNHLIYSDTVGSLQYDDYKGPNRQYVDANKLVVEVWTY